MKNILILCTGNSCRSIMAEALVNHYLNKKEVQAYSSGVSPSGIVNPNAIRCLQEANIATDNLFSKMIDQLPITNFDLVITVCDHAKETCPIFNSETKKIHCGFEDPTGKDYKEYVATMKLIEAVLIPTVEQTLFPKAIKDVATVSQTETGVTIELNTENEKAVQKMMQNCSEGKCECMSQETKNKITTMQLLNSDNSLAIDIKGFVTKEEIEAALLKSKVTL